MPPGGGPKSRCGVSERSGSTCGTGAAPPAGEDPRASCLFLPAGAPLRWSATEPSGAAHRQPFFLGPPLEAGDDSICLH